MFVALGFLQLFVAVGALGGGAVLVWDPSGATMGLPLTLLDGSPFASFLLPGIFLFVVNGLGSALGALLSLRRTRHAGPVAAALGAILTLWIATQIVLFGSVYWLHWVFGVLGLVELALGLWLMQKSR